MIRKLWSSLPIKAAISQVNRVHFVSTAFRYRQCFNFSSANPQISFDDLLKSKSDSDLQIFLSQLNGLSHEEQAKIGKKTLGLALSKELPTELLFNLKMQDLLKRYAKVYIEDELSQIGKLLGQINEALQKKDAKTAQKCLNSIDQKFKYCFQCLRTYTFQQDRLNSEITVHKTFADYYLNFVSELVEPARKRQILESTITIYKSLIKKITQVIEEEREGLKELSEQALKPNETKQDREKKLAPLAEYQKWYHSELINIHSQSLIHIINAGQLIKSEGEGNEFNLFEEKINLLPEFIKALQFYEWSGNKSRAKNYHRIKIMRLEYGYVAKIEQARKSTSENNNQTFLQQSKIFQSDLKELYEETVKDLQLIQKDPEHIEMAFRLSLVLLTAKHFSLMSLAKDEMMFQTKIYEELNKITKLIKDESYRKDISVELQEQVNLILHSMYPKQQ